MPKIQERNSAPAAVEAPTTANPFENPSASPIEQRRCSDGSSEELTALVIRLGEHAVTFGRPSPSPGHGCTNNETSAAS